MAGTPVPSSVLSNISSLNGSVSLQLASSRETSSDSTLHRPPQQTKSALLRDFESTFTKRFQRPRSLPCCPRTPPRSHGRVLSWHYGHMPESLRMREKEGVPWWQRASLNVEKHLAEVVDKMGLSSEGRWTLPTSEQPLDLSTLHCIHKKLDPLDHHVEDITDAIQTAREKLADSHQFLSNARQKRDVVVTKLRNVPKDPADWFVDVCRKETVLCLRRTFPEDLVRPNQASSGLGSAKPTSSTSNSTSGGFGSTKPTSPLPKPASCWFGSPRQARPLPVSNGFGSRRLARPLPKSASREFGSTKPACPSPNPASRGCDATKLPEDVACEEVRESARENLRLQFGINENVVPVKITVKEIATFEKGEDNEHIEGKDEDSSGINSSSPAVPSTPRSFQRQEDIETAISQNRNTYASFKLCSHCTKCKHLLTSAHSDFNQPQSQNSSSNFSSLSSRSSCSNADSMAKKASETLAVSHDSRKSWGYTNQSQYLEPTSKYNQSQEQNPPSNLSSQIPSSSFGHADRNATGDFNHNSQSPRMPCGHAESMATGHSGTLKVKPGDSDPLSESPEQQRVRFAQKATVTETSDKRVCIKGHYQLKPSDKILTFTVIVFRDEVDGKEQIQLCGSYIRQMMTTDKNLKWRFNQVLAKDQE